MALLWTDGFDTYGSSTIEAAMRVRYFYVDNLILTRDTGRTSGYSLKISSFLAGAIQTPQLTTDDTIICGFGYKYESDSANNDIIIKFDQDDEYVQLYQTGNNVGFSLKGDTPISSNTVELSPNTWYYIELKFTVGSNAAYELRVDGATTDIVGNGDTQSGSATYYDSVYLFPDASTVDKHYDDLYICDSTGNTCNDFQGVCKIVTLMPDGDDSCNFATLSTGTDHYALVDEVPVDNDTSYVEDGTSGNRDMLTYANLANVTDIRAVSIITTGKRTGTVGKNIKAVIESGNTTACGANYSLTTNYSSNISILPEDPDTSSSWEPDSINTATFGFEVV